VLEQHRIARLGARAQTAVRDVLERQHVAVGRDDVVVVARIAMVQSVSETVARVFGVSIYRSIDRDSRDRERDSSDRGTRGLG